MSLYAVCAPAEPEQHARQRCCLQWQQEPDRDAVTHEHSAEQKCFPPQVVKYANGPLKHKMMFGSDFPLIKPEKWLEQAKEVGFKEELLPLIMKETAAKVLGLK